MPLTQLSVRGFAPQPFQHPLGPLVAGHVLGPMLHRLDGLEQLRLALREALLHVLDVGHLALSYGPGKTQSITNTLVIDNIQDGKTPRVPVRDDTLRALIWTSRTTSSIRRTSNSGFRSLR